MASKKTKMVEPFSVPLARTQWKGDSPLVVDLLNELIKDGKETNRVLGLIYNKMLDGDRLETLLSMISDNTLCACEGINKLVDGVPEPPEETFTVLINSSARKNDWFGYNTTVDGTFEVSWRGEVISTENSVRTWDGQGSFPYLDMFNVSLENVRIGEVLTIKCIGRCTLREPNFPENTHRLYFTPDSREYPGWEVTLTETPTHDLIELKFVDYDYWKDRQIDYFYADFRRAQAVNWTVAADYHISRSLVDRFVDETLKPNIIIYKNDTLILNETHDVVIQSESDVPSVLKYLELTVGDVVDIRYVPTVDVPNFNRTMLSMIRGGRAVNAGVLVVQGEASDAYSYRVRYLVTSLSERHYIQEVPIVEATGVDWSITARYNVHESIVQRYAGEEVEIKCRLFKNGDQLSNVGVGEKISQVVSWDLIDLHTDLRVGDEIRLSYEISSDNLEMMNDIGLFQGGSLHSGMTVTYNEGGLKYEVVGRVYSLDEGTHFIDHPDLRLRDL